MAEKYRYKGNIVMEVMVIEDDRYKGRSTVCVSSAPHQARLLTVLMCICDMPTSNVGASEGILVWYGQPSEVQFTREGEVAE